MSVIRMLTRMCTVAALRGQTWAAERVFDSDNTPLSQALMLNAAAKPYIVVYTDLDNRTVQSGVDVYAMRRELTLVLEIGVASKVEGTTGTEELKIPLTDEGMEIVLDMVEDQALGALLANPQNDWSELFKGFVMTVERMSGQRGASTDRDKRWAARQISLTCDVVSDLPPGEPVPEDHPIMQFIEVSDKHPEADMNHAAEICAALASRDGAPQWERVQAAMGVRRLGLRAIGLAPLASELPTTATVYGDDLTDARGEAPILRKISPDDIDMEHAATIGLIDEVSAETNVVDGKPKEKPDTITSDGEVE
ncbi:MAG TPA: hypothetical protein VFP43_02885 [Mesorhizobium sp.]|nr:hypothetical protein [Mesorhizobium sp.]